MSSSCCVCISQQPLRDVPGCEGEGTAWNHSRLTRLGRLLATWFPRFAKESQSGRGKDFVTHIKVSTSSCSYAVSSKQLQSKSSRSKTFERMGSTGQCGSGREIGRERRPLEVSLMPPNGFGQSGTVKCLSGIWFNILYVVM